MKFSPAKKLAVLLASGALMICAVAPAMAQSASDASSNDNTTGTAKPASPQNAQTTKEQRKEARKEARAKKNAELKKLEDAGYQPSKDDPSYPKNLQNAEKKAGIGAAASQ
jgi:hypothetical protein